MTFRPDDLGDMSFSCTEASRPGSRKSLTKVSSFIIISPQSTHSSFVGVTTLCLSEFRGKSFRGEIEGNVGKSGEMERTMMKSFRGEVKGDLRRVCVI